MWNLIVGILDRVCAVTGALIFSQAPLFMQQYRHRLSGHVSELKYQVTTITNSAQESGRTTIEYLQKFLTNQDPDIAQQGELLQGIMSRFENFSHSHTVMQDSSIFMKPFQFVYHFNSAVFADTFHSFQPGLTFTTETVAYAVIGIGAGYLFFLIIRKSITKFTRLFGSAVVKMRCRRSSLPSSYPRNKE